MKLPTWLHREPEFDIEVFRQRMEQSFKDMTTIVEELSNIYPNISRNDIEQIVIKSYSKGVCRASEYIRKK